MKLRIKGDSLRFRLTQSDLKIFAESGVLEEVVHFPGKPLTYRLVSAGQSAPSAAYTGDCIIVQFPLHWLNEWTHSDRVGYESLSEGIRILIEKDFTCLENVAEDQSDQFPNPLKQPL